MLRFFLIGRFLELDPQKQLESRYVDRASRFGKGREGDSQEWHEDKEHLGRFIAPEGLEDSAQGFNPGNRPPGRRALKGRQIRRRRNGREAPIYLGPQSLHFVLVRIILAIGRLSLCLTNTLFLFGGNRTPLAHVISRPSGRTAFLDVSQG